MQILKTDETILAMAVITILLVIGFIVMISKLTSINKKYKNFLNKLGNGKNIEEDLENYMYRVERVAKCRNYYLY